MKKATTYEVESGELHELVKNARNPEDAARLALEKSSATKLGVLMRIRLLPEGVWHYLDTLAAAAMTHGQ